MQRLVEKDTEMTIIAPKRLLYNGSSLAERFIYQFKIWSCFFAFVFLPLDMIYRIDSFLLSWTIWDLVVNTAGMVIVMLIMATIVAIVAAPCSYLMSLVGNVSGKSFGRSPVAPYIVLLLSSYLFAKLFKYWVTKFNYEIPLKSSIIALIITAVIYWSNRKDFCEKIGGVITQIWRVVPVIVLMCTVLVGWRVISEEIKNRNITAEIAKTTVVSARGKPNVILITFDALSAEDMSLYGYHLKTTPNIDEFANECYVFNNCIAASNWTKPAVATLLTGKYPYSHRMVNGGIYSCENHNQIESLPFILKKKGYQNAAFVANLGNAHPFTNGTGQFFDEKPLNLSDWNEVPFVYKILSKTAEFGLILHERFYFSNILWLYEIISEPVEAFTQNTFFLSYSLPLFPPDIAFSKAQHYLNQHCNDDHIPIFVWIHVVPPHDPYLPPPPFKYNYLLEDEFSDSASQRKYLGKSYPSAIQSKIDRLRKRYDENILYADAAFGQFIRNIRDADNYDNTIIIISADHGESFSHGFQGHGGKFLYRPLINIPLIIHLPHQVVGERMINTVSQVDILPTILDLLGYPVPIWAEGVSLMQRESSIDDRIFYTMNLDGNPIAGPLTKGSVAIIDKEYKYTHYIGQNSDELYNLIADPEEANNVISDLPLNAAYLRQRTVEKVLTIWNRDNK